jgi:ATP-binding cassette subfamily F protein 3
MQSSEAMANAIQEFAGAAIVVTHDEDFLRRVATKLVVFHENHTFVYDGPYDDFLAEIGWGDEAVKPKISQSRGNPKDDRRARAQELAKKQATLKPLQDKIKQLEKDIAAWEKQYEADTALMVLASTSQDTDKIVTLSKALHDLREKIDFGYIELEQVSSELETAKQNDN